MAELRSKVTEAMALNMMPATSIVNGNDTDLQVSSPLYSNKYGKQDMILKSNLNPHASDYTPKTTM